MTFALLVDEILLSSIFHVLIGEGNAVAAISVALLGLSSSGVVAYLSPVFQRPDDVVDLYQQLLFWFGLSLMLSTLLIMSLPLSYIDLVFSRGAIVPQILKRMVYVVALVPFFLGGLCINVLIRHYSERISRLFCLCRPESRFPSPRSFPSPS